MKATKKKIALMASMALACVLALSLGVSGIFASATANESAGGRYYSDYSSKEDAFAAAEEINLQLAEEGFVLLKNDGTLPVSAKSRVSVFGIAQDCLVESSGTVTGSLRDAGFTVNPKLEEFYLSDDATSSSFGTETALGAQEKQSIPLYDDIGIVVLSRGTSGESADRSLNIGEADDETYLGNDQGWEHEAHEDGNKHELQLTDSEQEMIALAESTCKKVIVLYSSANILEMANLEGDEKINAILWIGRPGDGGIDAIGEILCGAVNPSGKTVDEWTRDFTNDPTYANTFSSDYTDESGNATAYSGVDYEEDIYLGYKFYETYWYEADAGNAAAKISGKGVTADEWYDYNVLYPFGYGLSYTDFSFELKKLYDNNGKTVGDTLSASDISSSTGSPAKIDTLYADVKVTNEGTMSGKEVVEIYAETPYTKGGTEKAYLTLVGYGKTGELRPGQSETLTVSFNVQDMASYDYADANGDGHTGYELDAGTYTLRMMESSSHENYGTAAYAEASFAVDKTAALDLDDYTGNEIENLFSGSTGASDAWKDDYYSMAVSDDAGSMTLLSRADFDGTAPEAPTAGELSLSAATLDAFAKYELVDADSEDWTDEGEPWEVTDLTLLSGWTQGAGTVGSDGMYAITLDDMAGVPLTDSSWITFMNQLTWDEIADFLNCGFHGTMGIETIGKMESSDENGPNYMYNSPTFAATPTRSATWNADLNYKMGLIAGDCALWQGVSGWYGPGANTHRSAFSGRNPEYYSQDSIQGGVVCAACIKGVTERGINAYVKHFGVFDMYTLFGYATVNISEQCMRENYLKIFQMAMQEGGSQAAMTSFNRIGTVYCGGNYALIQKLARDEWGWTGFTVTDTIENIDFITADALIRAGAEVPDGDFTGVLRSVTNSDMKVLSGTWDPDYVWTDAGSNAPAGAVMVGEGADAYASATQWYLARMSAQRILYNEANSAANNNGIYTAEGRSETFTVTAKQGDDIGSQNVSLVPDAISAENGYSVTSYEIVEGALPQGMYVEEGVLAGTPYEAGTFSATLNLYVDGWIPVEVNVNVTVTGVFDMEFDVSSIEQNESLDVYIWPEEGNSNFESTYEYTYTVADGALPTGLTLGTDGRITGTPTVAGEYTFTVAIEVLDPDGWVLNPTTSTQKSLYNGLYIVKGFANDTEFVKWIIEDGMYNGLDMKEVYEGAYYPKEAVTYYFTYTITVTPSTSSGSGAADAGTGSTGTGDSAPAADETDESSGCGSVVSLASAGIVLAIAAVAAAAVAVARKRRTVSGK